jgi:hypothetical protein
VPTDHKRSPTWRVIVVPMNPWRNVVEEDLGDLTYGQRLTRLQELVGGYFERVNTPQLQTLSKIADCGPIAMLVDEDGIAKGLRYNARASSLYLGDIYGDVVLISEGMTSEGPDFVGLTESMTAERLISIMAERPA